MNMWMKAGMAGTLAALLAACGSGAPAGPAGSVKAQCAVGSCSSGTTLSATKTATGYKEERIDYDWTLQKSADQASVTIKHGAAATISYTLNYTRTPISDQTVIGVRSGSGATDGICVTNGGAVATENLKIVDVVQTKVGSGDFQDYASQPVDVSAKPVLNAGESYCYKYDFTLTPVDGAQYRNTARVTITNHSGYLGQEFGPGAGGDGVKADFTIPDTATISEHDAAATLKDALTCPDGFSCTPASSDFGTVTGTGSKSYTVSVQNLSALCDSTFNLVNTATLTEQDSQSAHPSSASVNLYTDKCDVGCTLTIGFWKTHAGFTGNNPDRVTPNLPILLGTPGGAKTVTVQSATQAVTLLSFSGDASNGINKLYAQLLGAKLNIKNGADGSAVASTISSADTLLANKNAADWSSLSKAQQASVNALMTALDNYNNGLSGPGHCN